MKLQATFRNVWVEAFKLVISNLNGWSKWDLGKRSLLRMGGKTTVIDCQEEDTPEAMTHGAHPWAVERSVYMRPHTAQGLDHNAQLFVFDPSCAAEAKEGTVSRLGTRGSELQQVAVKWRQVTNGFHGGRLGDSGSLRWSKTELNHTYSWYFIRQRTDKSVIVDSASCSNLPLLRCQERLLQFPTAII